MRLIRLLAVAGLFFMFLSAVSVSSVAAATMPAPCDSDQLMVLASDTQGFAGTGTVTVDVANRGGACRIGGYPRVEFFNSKGVAVDRRDYHDSSMVFAEPRSAIVTLGHDGAASIGVSWSDNSVTLNGHTTTCPQTVSMAVALVHGVGHLSGFIDVSASPCGGGVTVTPIESGAWPRSNT